MKRIMEHLKKYICRERPKRLTDIASWHGHIPFAFAIVQMMSPKVLVELGTHKGDSYCAFCQAVASLQLDCRCFAVDTWEGDEQAGLYGAEVFEELRSHHDPLYGSFSSLLKMKFDEALPRFSDHSIDLLHIDGLHTCEAVRHDFESWLPKMSCRGIVLLHDTNVFERNFGVCKFWEEIQNQYPSFEFFHSHGLAILGTGDELPEEAAALFAADKEEAESIRRFFSNPDEADFPAETGKTETEILHISEKQPLISVIIPAYNHENYIADAVESVLNQTVKDVEIIIVNDGSTDNTGNIIDSFTRENIRVVHQKNMGTAYAVNRGLSLAGGKYISILNSDDIYHQDRLRILTDELEKKSEPCMAMSKVRFIDADRSPIQSGREYEWLQNSYRSYEKTGNFLLSLLKDNFICTSSNFVFRKDLTDKIGYFSNLRYVNDFDFVLRTVVHRAYVYSDQVLLDYRIHTKNTLRERETGKNRTDFLFELSWVLANFLENRNHGHQENIKDLCDLLAEVYHLNLDSILFLLLSFNHEKLRSGILENEREKNWFKKHIGHKTEQVSHHENLEKRNADLLAQITELYEKYKKEVGELNEKNEELFALIRKKEKELNRLSVQITEKDTKINHSVINNERLSAETKLLSYRLEEMTADRDRFTGENEKLIALLKKKDEEIVELHQKSDEIWQARVSFSNQLEEIINSKRYRLIHHIMSLFRFRDVSFHLISILKIILPNRYKKRLKELKQSDFVFRYLKTALSKGYLRVSKALTKPERHIQTRYSGPLVSVVIPCFNHGEFLEGAITCLQEQTFENFEIILIDDGSTEQKTVDRICGIEQRNIGNLTVIRQSNQGVIAARNAALSVAKGKYIFPLDADDTIHRTFLEKCVLYLESSPPNRFVYTWTHAMGESELIWDTRDTDPINILNENRVGVAVFPKEAFNRVGGYNRVMKDGYEDWEFYVNLVRNGYVGRAIPEPLYFYHRKTGSRNDLAVKKHELLNTRINDLHRENIFRNSKRLNALRKKRHVIESPMINLTESGESVPGKPVWLADLYAEKFDPLPTLSRLMHIADQTDENIIVIVSSRWKAFFELNDKPNVWVYFPEHCHPEGDSKILYEYLHRRYDPKPLDIRETAVRTSVSEQDRINILYIGPWLIVGGADTMTVDWFRTLNPDRFNTYFMTTIKKVNAWIHKIKGFAHEIYELPFISGMDRHETVQFILDFIRDRNIHIVHVMNSPLGFEALAFIRAQFPNVTTVAQFHCFDYLKDGRKTGYPYEVPMKYDRYVDYYNVEYHSLIDEVMEMFPYLSRNKFKVIYGCIDIRNFSPEKVNSDFEVLRHRVPDRLNILFIGRLDRQKQPLLMARIAAMLKAAGLPFVIHVLGEGSLESQKEELVAYIQEHSLSDCVRLHGEQPLEALPGWYRMGDVLLMTSEWEGVPIVLYQAMATELVCVAPDIGGISELLTNRHGWLIPDWNDADAYVRALTEIIQHRDLKTELGKKAREYISKRFDMLNLKKDYESFYTDIVQKRNQQGL